MQLNQADTVFFGTQGVDEIYMGNSRVWPARGIQKLHTLKDSFNTNLANEVWSTRGNVLLTDSKLKLSAADSQYATIMSVHKYVLQSSFMQIEVTSLPHISNGSTQTLFEFVIDDDNLVGFLWSNGQLRFRLKRDKSVDDLALEYDSKGMHFWRLSEAEGTIFWDTSHDGIFWMTRRMLCTPPGWRARTGNVLLSAGSWNRAHNPGCAVISNLNMPIFTDN